MSDTPQKRYVGRFLIGGILLTGGLTFLMTARGPFAGLGDGAGHYENPPAEGFVFPFAAYFICGVVAAASVKRGIRIGAAIIAHASPFLSLLFAESGSRTFFVVLALVVYAVFGGAWVTMLKRYDQTA